MNHERFEKLMRELDGNSMETLLAKNAKYAPGDDALHNFHSGGDVFGGTAAQACWGYLTKHLVALRDKVQNNDFHDREDLLEKCQDTINYVRFLWCIGNEEMDKYTHGAVAADEAPNSAYLKQKEDFEKHLAAFGTASKAVAQSSHDCYWHQNFGITNNCSEGVTPDVQR
jgi:hypothetical protein